MSANNDKFRRGASRSVNRAGEKLEMAMRRLILEANNRMIVKSPVDTGRFKGNWNVGNSVIDFSVNESATSSPYGAGAAYNNQVINMLRINGQTVYITNSLPYSRRLEYDAWSKQAPMGMVRVTVAELKPVMTKIGLEIKAVP